MSLQYCRVVLVRPQIAANVGATARVMRNLGLGSLVLVAPVADIHDRQARQLATHGEPILDRARIVGDFADAVDDCTLVVGTSARIGGLFRRQSVGAPEEIMPHVVAALSGGRAALVFGPEPSGLTNEEVTRCQYLIHIPADPEYPALNLAQAVAISLYELRRCWLKHLGSASASLGEISEEKNRPASFAEQERMFERLREALERIHFLYGTNADSLMHALRHLIGRAQPTSMEVDMLFGLARQLRWYAEHGHSHPEEAPAPDRPPSTNPSA